jgi:hypothetical protein
MDMIGDIRAFNEQVYRERRKALGHAPIPRSFSLTELRAIAEGSARPPLPYVGRERVKGFRLFGELLFVDTSGFGSSSEPALTASALVAEMIRQTEEHGSALAWGFVGIGQFQGFVRSWTIRG